MKPVIRYWGRKVGPIAASYINRYSSPKEVVLDPFGGAGTIAETALLMDRKVIYSDLNPIAVLIANAEMSKIDHQILKRASVKILRRKFIPYRDEKGEVSYIARSSLYSVRCKCGSKKRVLYFLWDGNSMVGAKVKCNTCKNPLIKLSEERPFEGEPVYFYPKTRLEYPDGKPFIKRRQVWEVQELFTKRNLVILSTLLNDIKRIKVDAGVKNALLIAFASILYQSSKMSRQHAGSWGINSYWLPKAHVERNPYILFENSLKRLMRKNLFIDGIREENAAILHCDARRLPLPDESVDLIVTDPPFADEIQYFELSYMTAAWLGIHMPFNGEIVVNENQGKTFDTYCRLLLESFSELYRVLKRNHRAVIMLHEEDRSKLTRMIRSVKEAGFLIEREDRVKMSQRYVGDRNTTKGSDLLILTCYKI
jgi:adenine-specific DNA methylase